MMDTWRGWAKRVYFRSGRARLLRRVLVGGRQDLRRARPVQALCWSRGTRLDQRRSRRRLWNTFPKLALLFLSIDLRTLFDCSFKTILKAVELNVVRQESRLFEDGYESTCITVTKLRVHASSLVHSSCFSIDFCGFAIFPLKYLIVN